MIIGTTPTHNFTLPFDTALIDALEITYSQSKEIVLRKYLPDCQLKGRVVTVKLTQEEALLFKCNVIAEVQIRVRDGSGGVFASNVMRFTPSRCISQEVL
jgi:hypothetical protein